MGEIVTDQWVCDIPQPPPQLQIYFPHITSIHRYLFVKRPFGGSIWVKSGSVKKLYKAHRSVTNIMDGFFIIHEAGRP